MYLAQPVTSQSLLPLIHVELSCRTGSGPGAPATLMNEGWSFERDIAATPHGRAAVATCLMARYVFLRVVSAPEATPNHTLRSEIVVATTNSDEGFVC